VILLRQLRQGLDGPSHADFNAIGQTRVLDIGLRDCGVRRIVLQRNEPSAGRQCAGQPDGAVAAERADFENVSGALGSRHQV
jgi:hypothetical protein